MIRRFTPMILAALLAACGGDSAASIEASASHDTPAPSLGSAGTSLAASASADAGRSSDYCSLLTERDVESATGYSVLGAESTDIGCVWTLDPGNGAAGLEHVSVAVHQPGGEDRFAFLETGGHEVVSGIGDGALRQNSNTGGTIWALSGDRLFTWTFAFGIDTEDPIPLMLPIVEQAIASE